MIVVNRSKCCLSKFIKSTYSNLKLSFCTRLSCDELSEEESLMQDTVRKFANNDIKPHVRKMDQQGFMDKSVLDSLFLNGLMGIEVPTEHGGANSTFFTSILVIEELAKVDPSISVLVDIQNTLIVTLVKRYGSDQQKLYWLPKLASDTVGSFALSEPESGSDAFSLKTIAKREGDDFVLNGSKCWISNSAEAGLFIVFANAAPEKKHRGITAFLVPRDTRGFSIGKKEDKIGLRASSTCTINFDNVRIPANPSIGTAGVLGEVGKGYLYAISMLNEGRIGIAAQMLGLSQGCFDETFSYVRDRRQFGQSIWKFQSVQHQISRLSVMIEALRTFIYNSARKKERGLSVEKEASMVKLMSSEVATETTSRCMELMGGVGFTKDYPIEKFYRDVKIGSIYEGTSNIQLNTIAKYLEKEISQNN